MDTTLTTQVRQLKLLLAAILAAVILTAAGAAFFASRSDSWSSSKCLEESYSASRSRLEAKGCFD